MYVCMYVCHADIMLRPSRFGGIGIKNPVKSAAAAYATSFEASAVLRNAIVTGKPVNIYAHNEHSKRIATSRKKTEDENNAEELEIILENLPEAQKDLKEQLKRITSYKCSAWLSVNPWEDSFFSLTVDEFKDSMACRYAKTPRALQAICDGCGEAFDANHALDCKNGGLVYQRHNELRDENIDLNRKAGFSQVLV
jgi:hypothetical protein